MRCVFCASTPLLRIFFSFFESSSRTSLGRYFGLSLLGLSLWSRVLCAPLNSLGETRPDSGRRGGGVDNSFGLLTVCRPKESIFFFSICLHKNTRKEHERRRVAGKTVEETRCARRRLVVVFLLSLSSLLLFFVVAKRAKERPLMTLFFSLFFSSSQPTTQKRTSRVISLSLYL